MADPVLTNLPHIQDFVISAITQADPLTKNPSLVASAKSVTTGNERLSPVEQLDIYREQFWLRHTGALEEDFVSVSRLLGADAFHELCALYIETLPPHSYTLRDLGDRFTTFVEAHPRYEKDALLHDLCRVEWAFVEAFDAADAAPIDVHKIASTPEEAWPNAILLLHPAVRLLALRHPAQELRITARTMESGALLERPDPKDTYVVVFRGADTLKFIDIDREAFVLLSKLRDAIPLGRACEETVQELALNEDAFQAQVGGWFSTWTQWGWVTDLIV